MAEDMKNEILSANNKLSPTEVAEIKTSGAEPQLEKPIAEIMEVGAQETKEERERKINLAREAIAGAMEKPRDEKFSPEKRAAYIEAHISEHLRNTAPSMLYRVGRALGSLLLKEVTGQENLFTAPKLFIANHRGGETPKLIGALKEQVHIASAETINWKGSKIVKWIMEKLGMVPVRESFSNVPEDKRQEVINRSSARERALHEQVVEETKNPRLGGNVSNIRQMVALLLRGDNVAIFAEGPFSRLEGDERRAYAGYALVAREYKRVTGEDLSIVPTGIRGRRVSFGESFNVDRGEKQTKTELEDIATQKIHSLYDELE